MWHLAAEQQPGQDAQTAIILGVIGLLTAVLVAVATGVFTLLSARANRTAPAPPPPTATTSFDGEVVGNLRERVAVLERRADDSDDRDEVQDRRLDQIEDRLDLDNPRWGHHDGR